MYNYAHEQRAVVFVIDMKSFYASVEAVARGYNPLQVPLVVASQAANTGSGLILAASPMAKQKYHISNVSRVRDLPKHDDLVVVPPRMNFYIQKNIEVNAIFKKFVATEDMHPYSIDETLLDLTKSWHLFGQSPREVARKIQLLVKERLGLYVTIGIGDNPTLAKLALDLLAKHHVSMIGEIHYEDVPDVLWPVTDLANVWSIGKKTALKLQALNIKSLYDLAHYNPYKFKSKFGVLGVQWFLLSWGIDRAVISEASHPKEKSYGNSQVLPRDYTQRFELHIVIREIAEQVAARLRAHHVQTSQISLSIGFSRATVTGHGFTQQCRLPATNSSKSLTQQLWQIFDTHWAGEPVRNISISYGQLSADTSQQLDLFTPVTEQLKSQQVDQTIDAIRQRFGFTAIVKASSLLDGGTAISRANLVGGHDGGRKPDER